MIINGVRKNKEILKKYWLNVLKKVGIFFKPQHPRIRIAKEIMLATCKYLLLL